MLSSRLRPLPPPGASARRGFSMIEVMIAVLVLALGMLGIASLQAMSLRNTQSSMDSSQAVLYTYSIIDAMRANRSTAIIGGYNLTSLTCNPPGAVEDPTTSADLAANDLHDWLEAIQRNVHAEACATVNCGSDECVVMVQWDDSRAIAGDSTRQVTTRTVL